MGSMSTFSDGGEVPTARIRGLGIPADWSTHHGRMICVTGFFEPPPNRSALPFARRDGDNTSPEASGLRPRASPKERSDCGSN